MAQWIGALAAKTDNMSSGTHVVEGEDEFFQVVLFQVSHTHRGTHMPTHVHTHKINEQV